MKSLDKLAHDAHAVLIGDGAQIVTGIACDSRAVGHGELFVSLEPDAAEARDYLAVAVERGASAVCLPQGLSHLAPSGLPLLLADDTRATLADLSAAFFDYPARALTLIGITGTLGKTSTAALIQSALARTTAGSGVGMIGSLGASVEGKREAGSSGELPDFNGMTTPDAPALHRALRAFVDAGIGTVVFEVTSHALAQQRVHGLRCTLGVFTNLIPDEHLEFHTTPDDYVRAKALFFEHLVAKAPVVFAVEGPIVAALVRQAAARTRCIPVGVALSDGRAQAESDIEPAVRVTDLSWDSAGSRFSLELRRELPQIGGGTTGPTTVPVSLPLLGVQHVTNAALAATAALCAGAEPGDVAAAFATAPAVRRRMEVVRRKNPQIIDDTTGNPETLQAVFTTVATIPRSGLRVLFGLRGSRGIAINTGLARTLGDLVAERASRERVRLVVTSSEEVADDRNHVTAEERDAALDVLGQALSHAGAALRFDFIPRLEDAARAALAGVEDDELVLLLGAQGMNEAAGLAEAVLSTRRAARTDAVAAERDQTRPPAPGAA